MRTFGIAALAALVACSASGPAPAPFRVSAVADLGALPLPSAITLGRDGGTGGALGGKTLWTFGDTFFAQPNGIDGSTVLSATGGWSASATPLALAQPTDGSGFPAQLVPYTADEIAANRADATHGIALWPAALLDTGDASGQGLLVFQRIQREGSAGFAGLGVGTARLAVDATIATRAPADLFASPEPLYQPSFAAGGYVYATACAPSGFLEQECHLARAPAAQADSRAAYTFWDGSGYQADITRGTPWIDRAGNAPSVVYNAHLGRYLAVNAEVVSSTVLLRSAPAIEGPWDAGVEIPPSASGILPPVMASDVNYLVLEHAELDAADGAQIVLSYSRPTTAFHGEVRLARVTIE